MEKRKLAKIPREEASDEMVRFAERAAGTHIVTTKDTLTARAVRGGKATSFGHMCHSCFAKWLTSHNIPVPDLENKKEIEDGKEKL